MVNGYDYENLGIFASIKEHETSSGKWGEGLKMLSLVALRNNIKMELRSRDWIATPTTQTVVLNKGETNEKEIEQLIYKVSKKINKNSKILDDGDEYFINSGQEMSSTTFIDPTPELIKEFRHIHEKIITLDKKRTAICDCQNIDLLGFNEGQLFIRDILIPGNHNLRYSYNLKKFNIENRDRNAINPQSMKEQLKIFLQGIGGAYYNAERFISQYLNDAFEYAKGESGKTYLEFQTPFSVERSDIADRWIKIFKENFGTKTSIRKCSDQDMDSVHRAEHMGLKMITLPDTVFNALSRMRGKDGETIPTYEKELRNANENIIMVSENDLTEQERKIIEHLYTYNKYLPKKNGEDAIKKIEIYSYDSKYLGTRAAGLASEGNTIMINRDTLNSGMMYLGNVFFHESGHAITGAEDASRAFRDFFTNLLSEIAMQDKPFEESKLQKSIDDNGIITNITLVDVKKIQQSYLEKDKKVRREPENGERNE